VTERVDVAIVGSGFGGSIAAFRLAELYAATEHDPRRIVVLERGRSLGHTDFRQSMDVENLSRIYGLIQGQGAQVVIANLVGGGSNLYLAASLRAPTDTFERTDHRPDDGPRRRMWPRALSRSALDPYYARAEAGLRVYRPGWDGVSKSGGVWAAMCDRAGHTCDRVPVAMSADRCVNAKWCYTGCIFGGKNSLITNYLASARAAGVRVRPLTQVNAVRQSSARPYRWILEGNRVDPQTKGSAGAIEDIEAKVVIVAAGAMGTPPLLMRSRLNGSLPSVSPHLGRHLGVNGDHVAAIECDPARLAAALGLDDGTQFYKGKPITTMSWDFWAGREGRRYDGTRFSLQEILLSQLTNFLYDDGRYPFTEPTWWGRQKKRSISTWSNHLEILAMVEDTNDGEFIAPPPGGGGHIQPNGGPVGIGPFVYRPSDQSIRVREAANFQIRRIAETAGLGRFLKLTETEGVYAAHPLGGCRMADSRDLGVTDDGGRVHGYEGLYCMDSSIIPTSLGVNPSLTISAVCERAAEKLVLGGHDLGLPRAPAGYAPGTPDEIVGDRVIP
jgi:choline dehydrogenase-like flavoprotein